MCPVHTHPHPATTCVCLGIEIDTEELPVSVPEEKLQKIIDLCNAWDGKLTCTKQELQSILGSLLAIHHQIRSSFTRISQQNARSPQGLR